MGQHEVLRTAPPLRSVGFAGTLDLHNLTIKDAHVAALAHVDRAALMGMDRVTVITGKSGPISAEFQHWLQGRSNVRRAVPLNDGGAWEVWLRKST
jgi:DNA-nicking Smr family endonuclease